MKPSVLVTAGPTREKIDPVRFISNYSTGTFGYAIAAEAARRGLSATLISGPTNLEAPKGVKIIRVETVDEMKQAVEKEFKKSDMLIMAAAVSDWKARNFSGTKIKRGAGKMSIELVENPDILAWAGRIKGRRTVVGFALETESLEKNARKKLKQKNLDLIVANRLAKGREAFGDNATDVMIIDRYGKKTVFINKTKRKLAKIILDRALELNIGYKTC